MLRLVAFLMMALLFLATAPGAVVRGEEEMQGEAVEQEQHQEQQQHQAEDPPPPPQEEAAPVEEEVPPVVEEEEVEPLPPPPQEEEPEPVVEVEATPAPLDDSFFEIKVFECSPPKGEPRTPPRVGPVTTGFVMNLCFRPKVEDSTNGAAKIKMVVALDYVIQKGNGDDNRSHKSVRDNQAVEPMTRMVCPMKDDPQLCIAATKLGDMFFESNAEVAAEGTVVLEVEGEERSVAFRYDFDTTKRTEQQQQQQAPLVHDFHDQPATPPGFPCAKEMRILAIMALLLTLLEFAFSPSSEVDQGDSSGKKKKTKITKVA